MAIALFVLEPPTCYICTYICMGAESDAHASVVGAVGRLASLMLRS
jgi:hypothetical protein